MAVQRVVATAYQAVQTEQVRRRTQRVQMRMLTSVKYDRWRRSTCVLHVMQNRTSRMRSGSNQLFIYKAAKNILMWMATARDTVLLRLLLLRLLLLRLLRLLLLRLLRLLPPLHHWRYLLVPPREKVQAWRRRRPKKIEILRNATAQHKYRWN